MRSIAPRRRAAGHPRGPRLDLVVAFREPMGASQNNDPAHRHHVAGCFWASTGVFRKGACAMYQEMHMRPQGHGRALQFCICNATKELNQGRGTEQVSSLHCTKYWRDSLGIEAPELLDQLKASLAGHLRPANFVLGKFTTSAQLTRSSTPHF